MRKIYSAKNTSGLKLAAALLAGGASSTTLSSVVAHAETTTNVKPGESLYSIASDHNVNVNDLAKRNNLKLTSTIHPNQKLTIPDTTYEVKKGDTVSEIAKKFNLNTNNVLKLNNLSWQNSTIYVGQKLKLKESSSSNSNISTTNKQQTNLSSQSQSPSQTANTVNTNIENTVSKAPSTISNAANLAIKLTQMNIPYVWGGESTSGMDCSGLTKYVYSQLGYSLPHNTVQQEAFVNKINTPNASSVVANAKPGDLLFWGYQGSSYHVAIYIGDGKYVAAPTPGQNVSIGSVYSFTPQFIGTLK